MCPKTLFRNKRFALNKTGRPLIAKVHTYEKAAINIYSYIASSFELSVEWPFKLLVANSERTVV